nr:hypothetical protein [Tanacetum cinerariifolium]
MDTTIDQQVARDEALVPHAKRLRIGRSNFRLLSNIKSKESTLQFVYDVLRLTPFFKAFLVTADFDALLPIELTNEDIRNSNAYKEYYEVATGVTPPKPKASVRKTRSSFNTTVTPPIAAAGPRLSTSAKGKQPAKASKAKSLHALSEVAMTEAQQLKLATKRSCSKHISLKQVVLVQIKELVLYQGFLMYPLMSLRKKSLGILLMKKVHIFSNDECLSSSNALAHHCLEYKATATIHHHAIRFKMDNMKHIVNLDSFKDMLHICPRLPGQSFVEPTFEEEILNFLCFLGHSGAIRKLTDVNINKLHQPWRSFVAIINKNVDFAYLMWEDFVYQVEHKDTKKSNEMYYPRFAKVIIHHFMSKDPSILKRNKVKWHYVRDDHMFTTIKLVSKHHNTQQFDALLPIELTNEKTRSSSDATITPSTTAAGPRLTTFEKGKQAAKASKAKILSALSEVAMTEAQQLKLATKKSLQQTHISQASGSGADEGTGTLPGVPDVSTDESEEDISWKSTDDEGDDDKGNDGDDDDEDTADKGNGEENLDLNVGREERHDEEEEEDELYRDININQGMVKVVVQIQSDRLRDEAQKENDEFLKTIDENMQKIIKEQVKEQVKRHRDDDADKDKEASAGSNRGSKRRREGKEPESASALKEKVTRSPPTLDRDWNKTLPATHESIQPWIRELAKQSDSRFSFKELMDTPIDFSNFLINRLKVDTLTLELLAGPTYELMKGSCKSLVELEFFLDDDKLYKFKEGNFKRLRIQDIEDMLLLLVQGKLTNLTVEEHFAFNVSLRIFTRSIVIQRRVEDLYLGVESHQKKLNLTRPDTYRYDLKRKEAYSAYSNPRGFIYQNKDKQNRLMRINDLHKFSDRTLTDVRTALDDRLKGIRIKYLPQSIWRKSDKDRAVAMIQDIDKRPKTRRIMRSLKRFVGGRLYEGDFKMLQRTI